MVRLPICEDCASRDFLCPVDREKLEKGYISQLDVDVSRILYDLDRYYRIGDEVELVRAHDLGSFVLLIIRGEMGRLIGKGGKVLKALRQRIGKPVRIVEIDVDLRKSVQDLFAGARIVGLSKARTKEGEVFKIYILRRDARFLPFPFRDLEKALGYILPGPFIVEFVE
ncbi:MAG: transcription elongation factor NusA [Candidatus Diapherotrites archaeon]|nr:transcription elongation factor NusA [Candidatus Diapherotrites archaeon]